MPPSNLAEWCSASTNWLSVSFLPWASHLDFLHFARGVLALVDRLRCGTKVHPMAAITPRTYSVTCLTPSIWR